MSLLGPNSQPTLIARGGSCDVFRFVRADNGETAVLKCLLAESMRHRALVAAFEHEKHLLQLLNGQGFCRLFEECEYLGRPAMVLEDLHADSLRVDRKASLQEAVSIVTTVLAALTRFHELSDNDGPLHALHRDVTPANVLIDAKGHCTLIDLGLSSSRRLPREGNALSEGTTGYCAPELYTNEPGIDARVDVFAAGVLLWELLAGKRLYPTEKFAAMSAILDHPARSILSERPDVSPKLAEIVHSALERDTHLRCKNAGDFHSDLNALQAPL